MSLVFVLEFDDENANLKEALVLIAHGYTIPGSHVHVAIREDAAKVLAVFKPSPSGPEEQETP